MFKTKKVLLLGHVGVGKTTLLKNLIGQPVLDKDSPLPSVGLSLHSVEIKDSDKVDKIVLWDIGGDSTVSNIDADLLKGTHAVIYLFDVTRPATYHDLEEEMKALVKMLPQVPFLLIANKADTLTSHDANDFAHFQHKVFLFSARKDADNSILIDEIKNLFENGV